MAETVPTVKITPAHRKHFAACIRKWQMALNLNDWRIGLSILPASKGNLAQVHKFDLKARVGTIRLAAEWDENNPPTDRALDDTALHEVLHIFLHETLSCHEDANLSADDKASSEHRVIQTLVHLLMGPG